MAPPPLPEAATKPAASEEGTEPCKAAMPENGQASKEAAAVQEMAVKAGGQPPETPEQRTPPTERFSNTKLNIALINDPKNGPRFTLTRKEAGQNEQPGDEDTDGRETEAKGDTQDGAGAIGKPDPVQPDQAQPKEKAAPRQYRPLGVPPGAIPPNRVPIDSSKTFIGPNGTFYDEAWRWMDWRGKKRSWNWPAALTFGHWFAYRRLYRYAALYVLWLAALAAALVNNVHVGLVAGLLILGQIASGLYGNILYFGAFRRAVTYITEKGKGDYDELLNQLAKAGGIRPKAPWLMATLTISAIGLALFGTLESQGGFQINIWPFAF